MNVILDIDEIIIGLCEKAKQRGFSIGHRTNWCEGSPSTLRYPAITALCDFRAETAVTSLVGLLKQSVPRLKHGVDALGKGVTGAPCSRALWLGRDVRDGRA